MLDIQKFNDVGSLLVFNAIFSGLLPILVSAKNKEAKVKEDGFIDNLRWPILALITATLLALLYVWRSGETLFGFTFLELSWGLAVGSVLDLLILWSRFMLHTEIERYVKQT